MSGEYYKERCKILEAENAILKEKVRKFEKTAKKSHNPNCDGDWICDECRPKKK
jgi:hypothetical protein